MKGLINRLSVFTVGELKQEVKRRETLAKQDLVNKTFLVVCRYYNTTMKDVLHKKEGIVPRGSGKLNERRAKKALMYIFRYSQKRQVCEIGNIMDRNHSSCSVASNKTRQLMQVDSRYEKEINLLIELIAIQGA